MEDPHSRTTVSLKGLVVMLRGATVPRDKVCSNCLQILWTSIREDGEATQNV